MVELVNQTEKGCCIEELIELFARPRRGPEGSYSLADLEITLEGSDQDPVEGEQHKEQQQRQADAAEDSCREVITLPAFRPFGQKTSNQASYQNDGIGNDCANDADDPADTINDAILPDTPSPSISSRETSRRI